MNMCRSNAPGARRVFTRDRAAARTALGIGAMLNSGLAFTIEAKELLIW